LPFADALLEENYIVNFPKNYHMRHRTFSSTSGKAKDDKPRQDPFVFGHPSGPGERYRSPAEFALHILWLLSASELHEDCSCPLCKKMVASEREVPPRLQGFISMDVNTTAPPTVVPALPPTPASVVVMGGGAELFRLGELIWYKPNSWRLGIILQVHDQNVDFRKHTYRIAPLGHVNLGLIDVPTFPATGMRPFLGFSVPAAADHLADRTYDQINWPAEAIRAPNNKETLGLEASKLAAKKINGCFSLFNKLQSLSASQVVYRGVFLGAEQIRVGDAIRIQSLGQDHTKPDIMAVKSIYSEHNSRVKFVGSTYRLLENGGNEIPGAVFSDEARLWTEVTRKKWGWAMVEKDAVKEEPQVLGRFYASSRFMEIAQPERFREELKKGVVMNSTALLNMRLGLGKEYSGRKMNREATIGEAICSPLQLGAGIAEESSLVV
jgi:hypothetical protein